MKTTIDIPEKTLKEALLFTGAKTKRDAVLTALDDFNKRQRTARLARHLGTCRNLISAEKLLNARRQG